MEQIASTRVYKKTSSNSVLTLYLGSRDLISRRGIVEPLRGVIYIDPKFMCSQKIYGQLTLTFRYGREDEEVMGLKFCNEAVIAIKQIWPRINYNSNEVTPLQQALVDRLGHGAHPFSLEIGMIAPPSVQLVPAKKYCGAPIGTSYDIRIYMSDLNDERFLRRTTVKLGIRLLHKIPSDTRIIQQTNPTYTSLPKSIRLRLSPKQLKFHHHKTRPNSKTTKSIDLNSVSASANNVDYCLSTSKDLATTTTTTATATTTTTVSANDEVTVIDEKGNTRKGAGVGVASGLTIRLPTAPTATANFDTHPLTLNCNSSDTDYAKPVVIDSGSKQEIVNGNYSVKGAEGSINKPFLWTEGRVSLKASLNKSAYKHGESVFVKVDIKNNSKKIIRKIRVFAVQHVDVCMFSNGKFKNVVADFNECHQIKPNEIYNCTYNLVPVIGPTKNWIAVEGSFSQGGSIGDSPTDGLYKIASSAHRGPSTEDRNVFAIYVSYYVKVKLTLSGMGGEVSLKLPFILGYVDDENDSSNCSCNCSDDDDNTESRTIVKNIVTGKCEATSGLDSYCGKIAPVSSINENNSIENNKCTATTENASRKKENNINNDDVKKKILNKDCEENNSLSKDKKGSNNSSSSSNKTMYQKINSVSDIICSSCANCTTKYYSNNIIEEELHEDDDDDDEDDNHDTMSLLDENDEIEKAKKTKEIEEKHLQEKTLLQNLKLKRSSYSRSWEDIDSICRSDGSSKIVNGDCSWNGQDNKLMLSQADSLDNCD